MKTYNLKSHLNFEAKKRYVPCLNENYQDLATIDFDEVYEGYKIYFSKVESLNTKGLVYYEASSNTFSSPTTYKTLEDMCDFYNEWKDELINAKN